MAVVITAVSWHRAFYMDLLSLLGKLGCPEDSELEWDEVYVEKLSNLQMLRWKGYCNQAEQAGDPSNN